MECLKSDADVVACVSRWKSVVLITLVATSAFAQEADEKRLMATIQGVAGAAAGRNSVSVGPGIGGELGYTIAPGWALGVTAELHGMLIVMCGQAGVLVTRWLSQRVGLGFGARLVHVQPFATNFTSPNTSIALPVRLLVALNGVNERGATGLVLSVAAWGGVQVGGTFYGGVGPTGGVTVGLGHGTW